MRSSHLGRIGIGALLLASLTACNLFIPPPQMRSDSDVDAQLRNFHVVQVDGGTMVARFSWPYPPEWMDDWERIDTVRVVYQSGSAPIGTTQIMPPPYGGGNDYTSSTSVFARRWNIQNIPEPGTEVWFALFAHSERGWWAPVYDKLTIRDSTFFSTPDTKTALPTIERYELVYDELSGTQSIYTTTTSITLERDSANSRWVWAVLVFDVPEDVEVTYASLDLGAAPTNDILAFPLVRASISNESPQYVRSQLVDPEFKSAPVIINTNPADITPVVQRAIHHGSRAILLGVGADPATETINPPEQIGSLTYYSFE
jgi:hypothetical protein